MAKTDPDLNVAVAGVAAGIVGVLGYMLTELGHYGVYRKPIYYGPFEKVLFTSTVVGMIAVAVWVLW